MNQVWLAFITGLTTGGISCLAVQGGLLASSLSNQERELTKKQRTAQIAIFLLAKIIVYTLLGAFLGILGSSLIISSKLQGWFQIFVGLFMLATAARLLNLHPIFRYFAIQPPKFIYKMMRDESKSKSIFSPAILGAMTIFIPCGITQAMLVLATASGSPILGAGIMFGFTLGTSPIFFVLGVTFSKLIEKKAFLLLAAGLIAFLGLLSINTGQVLRGSIHNLQNYYQAMISLFDKNISSAKYALAKENQGSQEITINVQSNGYLATSNTVKKGVPVKLKLITNNTQGCSRAFTIPSLNISKILPATGTETIEFTPQKEGKIIYTCSMGMFSGTLTVI